MTELAEGLKAHTSLQVLTMTGKCATWWCARVFSNGCCCLTPHTHATQALGWSVLELQLWQTCADTLRCCEASMSLVRVSHRWVACAPLSSHTSALGGAGNGIGDAGVGNLVSALARSQHLEHINVTSKLVVSRCVAGGCGCVSHSNTYNRQPLGREWSVGAHISSAYVASAASCHLCRYSMLLLLLRHRHP